MRTTLHALDDCLWEPGNRDAVMAWMHSEGLEPDITYQLDLMGEGQIVVHTYALNEAGDRYSLDGETCVKAPPLLASVSVPPPFIYW